MNAAIASGMVTAALVVALAAVRRRRRRRVQQRMAWTFSACWLCAGRLTDAGWYVGGKRVLCASCHGLVSAERRTREVA